MTPKKTEKPVPEHGFNKQEIIYSAIVEKELLHNGMVQREMLRTLKELSTTMSDLTAVIQKVEKHQFLEMHKRKWKVVLYNIAMGMLFAIGTVLGLFLLSWSTFHFFKDSTTLKNIIENQLKLRNIDIGQMKEDATGGGKVDIPSSTTKQVPVLVIPLDSSKKDSK